VLDEAQAIKNPESQARAKAAFALKSPSFRLALSGTPVENRLEELWSLFHFLNPGLLGRAARLRRALRQAHRRGRQGAAVELRERLRPFVLRRLKKEVAPELPPRTEVVLRVSSMSASARRSTTPCYAATKTTSCALLGRAGSVLARCSRRCCACARPAVTPRSCPASTRDVVEARRSSTRCSTEVVAEGHKALVFSQWTSPARSRRAAPRRAGARLRAPRRLDARPRRRGDRVPGRRRAPVMLISLKAGGTGLNAHRGRSRVPRRPVVEPGRRSAGRRSRAPHRAGQAGARLPARVAKAPWRSASSRCSWGPRR
jgi:hypothetical protein